MSDMENVTKYSNLALIVLVLSIFVSQTDGALMPLLADGAVVWNNGPPSVCCEDMAYVGVWDDGHNLESKGIIEFDVSSMISSPANATLRLWQLDGYWPGPTITLFAYEGDGNITVADGDSPAITVVYNMDYPIGENFYDAVVFETDVSSALQHAFSQGWTKLGFRLDAEERYDSFGLIYATDGTGGAGFDGNPPELEYQVPEPATLSLLGITGLGLLAKRRKRFHHRFHCGS